MIDNRFFIPCSVLYHLCLLRLKALPTVSLMSFLSIKGKQRTSMASEDLRYVYLYGTSLVYLFCRLSTSSLGSSVDPLKTQESLLLSIEPTDWLTATNDEFLLCGSLLVNGVGVKKKEKDIRDIISFLRARLRYRLKLKRK